MRRVQWCLPILLIILCSGCAHVISKDIRASSDLSVTFKQVYENPDSFKGKSVIWGGDIVQVINQADGTTEIEVFQRSLGWRGEPIDTVASEGRFLIQNDKYFDPYLFWRGRRITVAGEVKGGVVKPIGQIDYRYPLILSKQIYLWKEYHSYSYITYSPQPWVYPWLFEPYPYPPHPTIYPPPWPYPPPGPPPGPYPPPGPPPPGPYPPPPRR